MRVRPKAGCFITIPAPSALGHGAGVSFISFGYLLTVAPLFINSGDTKPARSRKRGEIVDFSSPSRISQYIFLNGDVDVSFFSADPPVIPQKRNIFDALWRILPGGMLISKLNALAQISTDMPAKLQLQVHPGQPLICLHLLPEPRRVFPANRGSFSLLQ